MEILGRFIIIASVILFLIGIIFSMGGKVPFIGRLPGDIAIERENFRFYFPVVTSIILSIILSIIFSLFNKR